MAATSSEKCPFKYDSVLGEHVTCAGTACAAWNATAGECLLLAAALRQLGAMKINWKEGNRTTAGIGVDSE